MFSSQLGAGGWGKGANRVSRPQLAPSLIRGWEQLA